MFIIVLSASGINNLVLGEHRFLGSHIMGIAITKWTPLYILRATLTQKFCLKCLYDNRSTILTHNNKILQKLNLLSSCPLSYADGIDFIHNGFSHVDLHFVVEWVWKFLSDNAQILLSQLKQKRAFAREKLDFPGCLLAILDTYMVEIFYFF